MLIEDAFDFGGIDVLAAGNDHVLHPVSDVEEAVIVEVPDVTGVEPALRIDGRRGRVRATQYPFMTLGPRVHTSPLTEVR